MAKTYINQFVTKYKKSKFFRQMLFCFFAIICFISFLFTFLLSSMLNKSYKDDSIQMNLNQVIHEQSVSNALLSDIFTYSHSVVLEDYDVISLLYGTEFKQSDALNGMSVINRFMQSSEYIHSINLINFNTNSVLTNVTRMPIDEFYDQELISYIKSLKTNSPVVVYLPHTIEIYQASFSRLQENIDVWSLIIGTNNAGALVINIDQAAFCDLIDLSTINTGSSSFLLNKMDQVLDSNDYTYFKQSFPYSKLGTYIRNLSSKSGYFDYLINNKKYTVYYAKESNIGLISIKLVPYTLLDTTNGLLISSLLISLVFLLVTLLIGIAVSLILYKPVNQFMDTFSEPVTSPTHFDDEFKYVTNIYNTILRQNKNLEHSVHAYKLHKENFCFYKLLTASNTLAPDEYTELVLQFDKQNYKVFVIAIDDSTYTLINDYSLLTYIITNVADELLTSLFTLKSIELSGSKLAYILNFNELDDLVLLNKLTSLQNFMKDNYQIAISIGISSTISDFDDISLGYNFANTALLRKFANDSGNIIFYNHIPIINTQEQKYPFSIDAEFIVALKNLQSDKLTSLLQDFFSIIRSYDYNKIIMYILWLNYSIQRIEYANNLQSEDLDLTEITRNNNTLDDIYKIFLDRCLNILSILEAIKINSSEKSKLINTVISLVKENLYNPNLSVIFIANEVHLSVNYLRSIYKECTGESLSNYITQQKLDLIYYLLSDTDLSIQAISEQLGFTTKNYFFTFFKKHTNITPTQYRKLNKQSSPQVINN